MRKGLFSLLIAVVLFSCQKNFQGVNKDQMSLNKAVTQLSKNTTTLSSSPSDVTSTFDDLLEFPVNIIVRENYLGNTYLTAGGVREKLFFAAKKNDSTQVFYLSKSRTGDLYIFNISAGGKLGLWYGAWSNSSDSSLNLSRINGLDPSPYSMWRILGGGTTHEQSYLFRNIGNNKVIGSATGGNSIFFDSYINTGRQEFEIRPIDDFELVDIEYINDASATMTQQPDFVTQWFYSNNTSLQQSMSTSFSQKATETSSFSQTTGGSLSVSVGFTVKVPFIANGTINTTLSANHSATYGKSETKEDAQTYNFPINVAPRTSVTATATVGKYLINLKYKAKMRGINTGKLLTVNGVWEGVSCTTVRVDIDERSLDSGMLLNHITLSQVPKTTFSFKK